MNRYLCVVIAALGHGQRAMPEDAFKPAELQASMHDSVASQAKAGTPMYMLRFPWSMT